MRPSVSSGTTSPTVSDTVQSASELTVTDKDGALTDDFLMNYYKVVPCKRKYAHDWASCPWAHSGERASRRALDQHLYLPIACHYAKQRMPCPLGDRCTNAHNLFEYWLHPKRFRTELCQFATNCERPVCFFGHNTADLRPLDPSLPPAEACWSAGAAFRASRSPQQPPQPYQQRQGQGQGYQQQRGQWQGRPRMMGTPRSSSYSGQSSPVGAGIPEAPGLVSPQQQHQRPPPPPPPPPPPQQQQQGVPVLVINPLQGCDTPSTPSPNPAVHSMYTPPQQQQQLVILQTGQPGSSNGYATVMPAAQGQAGPQMLQVPVLAAGSMQGTYAVPSPQVQAVQVQQPVQHAQPVQPQPVLQYTPPGSSQPTYWVQVQDPNAVNTSPHMAGGQVMQLEQPATVIAAPGNTLPTQTYVTRDGYMQQPHQQQPAQGMFMQQVVQQQQAAPGMFMQQPPPQQQQPAQGMFMQQVPLQQQPSQGVLMQGMEHQQQQAAQGMFMQQMPLQQQPSQGMFVQQVPPQQHASQGMFMQSIEQLQVPNPPGLQDVSTLGGTAAGVMGAGGPMQAVQEVPQQQSSGSWQYMYAASSQAVNGVLDDLQGMRLN